MLVREPVNHGSDFLRSGTTNLWRRLPGTPQYFSSALIWHVYGVCRSELDAEHSRTPDDRPNATMTAAYYYYGIDTTSQYCASMLMLRLMVAPVVSLIM
jgi:hypothetical protein